MSWQAFVEGMLRPPPQPDMTGSLEQAEDVQLASLTAQLCALDPSIPKDCFSRLLFKCQSRDMRRAVYSRHAHVRRGRAVDQPKLGSASVFARHPCRLQGATRSRLSQFGCCRRRRVAALSSYEKATSQPGSRVSRDSRVQGAPSGESGPVPLPRFYATVADALQLGKGFSVCRLLELQHAATRMGVMRA